MCCFVLSANHVIHDLCDCFVTLRKVVRIFFCLLLSLPHHSKSSLFFCFTWLYQHINSMRWPQSKCVSGCTILHEKPIDLNELTATMTMCVKPVHTKPRNKSSLFAFVSGFLPQMLLAYLLFNFRRKCGAICLHSDIDKLKPHRTSLCVQCKRAIGIDENHRNTNSVDGMISKPQRLNLAKWDCPEWQRAWVFTLLLN